MLAARRNGRKHLLPLVDNEKEESLCRRLFDDFQKPVGGLGIHHLGKIHYDRAVAALQGPETQHREQTLRLIDRYHLLLRLQLELRGELG